MSRALGWLLGVVGALVIVMYGVILLVLTQLAQAEVPTWAHFVGAGGAALIGLWLFLDWGSLSNLGKDQTVTRSALAGLATLLAVGLGFAANVVSHKYDTSWDFTETKRYTLSDQSIEIAKALDREVKVTAFFPHGIPAGENFRDLLEKYEQHTTLLRSEFHDPYGDPLLAQEKKIISTQGTVIVEAGENEQRLESDFDEEAFTNALIKVTADTQHAVCVVNGHGEADPRDESTERGFGILTLKLEGQNYKVETLSLLDKQPAPDTCKVVLVPSPQNDLLPAERDRLVQYVAAGGNLIVMIDPLLAQDTAKDMERFGVRVGNDVVVEADPNRQIQGGDPTYIVLDESSFDIHPITSKLKGVAVLALARSVDKGPEVSGLNVQVLARASEESWGETTITDATVPAQPDPGTEIVTKVPLMAAVEVTDPANLVTETVQAVASASVVPVVAPVAPTPPLPRAAGGKVVVLGDSDFASNLGLLRGVNQDIVMNSVAWMVGESEQISIRANEAGKGKLTLDVISTLLAGLVAMLVVPGLAVVAAVATWVRRRKL